LSAASGDPELAKAHLAREGISDDDIREVAEAEAPVRGLKDIIRKYPSTVLPAGAALGLRIGKHLSKGTAGGKAAEQLLP
jgi:hypothetical protein